MPGEMELKPGEIVFLPDGSGASRGAFSVPHPLPLRLPHPLLSICSSEGSVVITNPGGEPPSAAGHTKPWGWPLVWSRLGIEHEEVPNPLRIGLWLLPRTPEQSPSQVTSSSLIIRHDALCPFSQSKECTPFLVSTGS